MFTKTINPVAKHQVVCGPNGITLELDSKQVYPADPGMGTPRLVWFKGDSMTFDCAQDNGSELGLDSTQVEWLQSPAIYDKADEWLTHWTRAKGGE